MRIAIIVTDFPKVTETFILRDLVNFNQHGHEVRIYHLTAFRRHEVVHEFAKESLGWAHYEPYILGIRTIGALAKNLIGSPGCLFRIAGDIMRAYRNEPEWLIKSLLIIPKCLAISEDIKQWNAGHVHAEFATHPATTAWINHRLTGIPYSVSCHAHDIFLTQSLLKQKLGEAAFVRTVSKFNQRFLEERVEGLAGKQVEVIHVSVDSSNIKPFEKTKGDHFQVLYVGSLEERKGVNFLIEALARLNTKTKDWCCKVIGDGPEHERLKELTRQSGLNDKIEFMGARSFEEVITALEKAHVMVVPSIIGKCGRTEGLPTVIIEALAYQRPVIASRVTGVPELIDDGNTGLLVSPGNSDEIYQALWRILINGDDAFAMAQRGRQRIEEEFDLHKNAAAQLELFKKFHAHAQGSV